MTLQHNIPSAQYNKCACGTIQMGVCSAVCELLCIMKIHGYFYYIYLQNSILSIFNSQCIPMLCLDRLFGLGQFRGMRATGCPQHGIHSSLASPNILSNSYQIIHRILSYPIRLTGKQTGKNVTP